MNFKHNQIAARAVVVLLFACPFLAESRETVEQDVQQTTRLTPAHISQLATVSDPRISPAGEWIAYTVERDNFDEDFGLLSARYAWNVGDRTSFLASAYYDLFDDAQVVEAYLADPVIFDLMTRLGWSTRAERSPRNTSRWVGDQDRQRRTSQEGDRETDGQDDGIRRGRSYHSS